MSTITGSILIDRPVEEVFDYVADERHEPAYNPEMTSVSQVTDGPVGVGTRWDATLTQRGRRVRLLIEVTEHARPRRLGTRSTTSGMDIEGVLTFTPEGDQTRMDWRWQLMPRGWLRLAGPLVGSMGRRQERRIWASLKRVLETGG